MQSSLTVLRRTPPAGASRRSTIGDRPDTVKQSAVALDTVQTPAPSDSVCSLQNRSTVWSSVPTFTGLRSPATARILRAASWMLARSLSGLLFGVTSSDPVTFFGMLAVLFAVAAIAGYLPARRASRIDPSVALRAN